MLALIWEALQSVLVVLIIILLGFVLQRFHVVSLKFNGDIAKIITYIGLPTVIFYSLLTNVSHKALISLFEKAVVPGIGTLLTYVIAELCGRLPFLKTGQRGVFVNSFVNTNTTFIGLAINNILFGKAGLASFLVFFLINNLSVWGIGFYLFEPTQRQIKPHFSLKALLENIFFKSPPLVAFIVGFVVLSFNWPMPLFVMDATQILGSVVTPLSLLYLGIMLYNGGLLKSLRLDIGKILALVGRFVIEPLIMFLTIGVASHFFPHLISSTDSQVWLVQSAMPAIAILPILASQKGSDYRLGTDIVILSTVLFMPVLPLIFIIARLLY